MIVVFRKIVEYNHDGQGREEQNGPINAGISLMRVQRVSVPMNERMKAPAERFSRQAPFARAPPQ